jgi:hypothetical protein
MGWGWQPAAFVVDGGGDAMLCLLGILLGIALHRRMMMIVSTSTICTCSTMPFSQ